MMKFVLPRYLYQNMHMASPSLPSVETNHSFGREMIHCVQWMHPTPCVLSETALSGLQFIILAWHEAGKIPAADSPLVFSPLCYNSTFFVWLSLDLGPCLKWVHARHWKTIHVSSWFWTSATHRQSDQTDSLWVEEELAIVQPGYPSGKNRTLDSFCVTYSGSVRSRTICVIKWRTFYRSSPGLWLEQCLTSLPTLPAAPGTLYWRNIPHLRIWVSASKPIL